MKRQLLIQLMTSASLTLVSIIFLIPRCNTITSIHTNWVHWIKDQLLNSKIHPTKIIKEQSWCFACSTHTVSMHEKIFCNSSISNTEKYSCNKKTSTNIQTCTKHTQMHSQTHTIQTYINSHADPFPMPLQSQSLTTLHSPLFLHYKHWTVYFWCV